MTSNASAPDSAGMRGFIFAFSAYFFWGILPLYLKLVGHIPAVEVVAHRIIWSVPLAGIVLYLLGRTADVRAALCSPRTLAMAAVTACLITVNWGVYVWAIAADRAVETSLGYYINPLMSVVMGAVFLGERFTRMQMVAVALAACAVLLLTVAGGGLPWVSLVLAVSFTLYGFFRKTLPIGPSQGFFLEVLILCLPALLYLIWLQITGGAHFVASSPENIWLLLGCGPATALPLLLYGFGAKLLKLSTIGLMQYMAPTMVFLIAVFVFGEPFDTVHAIAFGMIWVALAIYTWSIFASRERHPKTVAQVTQTLP
ncbi:EamA family transporter RarD [Mesorhizobium sp. NBSH29]|uniref:EamA family transporter RarD n=1 Tax=Mesorhizobium sp. NBSH29 TaxID=2654249 RepID=UPI0018968B39|nr:EamA family transporter RarD [Mesorhizobium sp. NBSH29]QPC88670.1 EamA family transporter RarD [Mesorhizobium sp. NBSH29]